MKYMCNNCEHLKPYPKKTKWQYCEHGLSCLLQHNKYFKTKNKI